MKNSLTLLFSIAIIGLTSGQNSVKDKQTAVVQKDTVKKEKIVEEQPEIEQDSAIVYNGKFKPYKRNVHASYYAQKFVGKRTSNGQKFSNNKYTAAHRKFPFGTKLRVTNEATGKSVIVEVTDRGPFSRGREIDLTKRAFMEIVSNKNSGSLIVKIEVAD